MKDLKKSVRKHRLAAVALISLAGLLALLLSVSGSWAQTPIPHAVEKEGEDCLTCHQSGAAGAPRVSWDHLGRADEDCLVCHKYTGALPSFIPHPVEGQEGCWDCHETGIGTAGPLAGDHVDYANETCLDCHFVSPDVPPPTPVLPTPIPQTGHEEASLSPADCLDCHQLVPADGRHTEIVGLSPGDADEGEALFGEHCARCHGEEGEQAVRTAAGAELVISSLEYLSQQDTAGILVRIATGAEDLMPAFGPEEGGPFSWAEVRSVASFVRAWGPQAIAVPTAGDAVYGAELYAEHCAACHGSEGQGGPAAREPINTTEYLAGITDDGLRQIILGGTSGMPGYANRLTDEFVDDLIAFMRSWQQ